MAHRMANDLAARDHMSFVPVGRCWSDVAAIHNVSVINFSLGSGAPESGGSVRRGKRTLAGLRLYASDDMQNKVAAEIGVLHCTSFNKEVFSCA